MRGFLSLLKRFHSDERGAFLVIFGVLAIVLVASSGAVVDYTAIEQARTRAQVALDTAALGLQPTIKISGVTEETVKAKSEQLLMQQLNTSENGGSWAICDTQAVPPCVRVDDVTIDTDLGTLRLDAELFIPTSFVALIGFPSIKAGLTSEATRGSVDVEVAVALDITGSMLGTKIADLITATKDLIEIVVQDVQTPTYSKVALVPYSMAVNVGSYAEDVRGPIEPAKPISGASWEVAGSEKVVTAVTKANPARVTTLADHGYQTGDKVYISGVGGMWQINNKVYTITKVTAKRFTLDGVDSTNYSDVNGNGKVKECQTALCEVVVTSTSHGFADNDYVRIANVGGMWQINNRTLPIAGVTTNTFILSGVVGTSYNAYTSGGDAYCTNQGCEYLYFENADLGWTTFRISTCASDRETNAWNDASPSTTYLGRVYAGGNPCPAPAITPLTSSKTTLNTAVGTYVAAGSTAGQLGLAWAWYMLSPKFGYLWPEASRPSEYDEPNVMKVLILMTDGAFNTTYCDSVISRDSTSGSGGGNDHINCDAPNGDGWAHAKKLCDAIKADEVGIEVYTVGFDIAGNQTLIDLMKSCATDAAHAFTPASGADLKADFKKIAQNISSLRLSH
jgi:Flp pilus assembly protein TadG